MSKYLSETTTIPQACLGCGYVMDRIGHVMGGRGPQAGDISICIKCGHIMAFTVDLKFRPLTDNEMLSIAGNPELVKIQKTRATVMLMEKLKLEKSKPPE